MIGVWNLGNTTIGHPFPFSIAKLITLLHGGMNGPAGSCCRYLWLIKLTSIFQIHYVISVTTAQDNFTKSRFFLEIIINSIRRLSGKAIWPREGSSAKTTQPTNSRLKTAKTVGILSDLLHLSIVCKNIGTYFGTKKDAWNPIHERELLNAFRSITPVVQWWNPSFNLDTQ